MWFFIIAFPYVLVSTVNWWIAILVSVAINFVFSILEKSGTITEEPFEDRAADTPMSSITRNIEIDLLEMLGDDNIPEPWPAGIGKFNVEYIK
ncbi:MAG: bestrophin family ion channel [Gammaproteobacteria bacterium]